MVLRVTKRVGRRLSDLVRLCATTAPCARDIPSDVACDGCMGGGAWLRTHPSTLMQYSMGTDSASAPLRYMVQPHGGSERSTAAGSEFFRVSSTEVSSTEVPSTEVSSTEVSDTEVSSTEVLFNWRTPGKTAPCATTAGVADPAAGIVDTTAGVVGSCVRLKTAGILPGLRPSSHERRIRNLVVFFRLNLTPQAHESFPSPFILHS